MFQGFCLFWYIHGDIQGRDRMGWGLIACSS